MTAITNVFISHTDNMYECFVLFTDDTLYDCFVGLPALWFLQLGKFHFACHHSQGFNFCSLKTPSR